MAEYDVIANISDMTEAMPEFSQPLRSLDIEEFLSLDIPPREMVLGPVIPAQGLVMLYSKRGVGKTHVGLSIAYAVASGSSFLRCTAPKPRRVLVLDGEMPGRVMQERLASIVNSTENEPPSPDYLKIITADLQLEGFPDLASENGQETLEAHLEGVELVIVDNLSTLCRFGRENEAESWAPVQAWMLALRRRGISVLLVHHAGKGGNQRGTSRREDVLDVVINLRHPEDYSADEGARFEVHLEKARGIVGDDAKPFEAKMEIRDGSVFWTMRDLEDVTMSQIMALTTDGMSIREIASELGMGKSKVQRLQNKAREMVRDSDI